MIVKYNTCLKILLQQGISEHVFDGDLVYKFKRIVGKSNFSDQFKNIIKRYKIGAFSMDTWLLTQLRLIAMVSSLIFHDGGSGLRLNDGHGVKL